jgi:glyoxylase-like metal-dependent hydrolase (beta-lactamase superfamily II)
VADGSVTALTNGDHCPSGDLGVVVTGTVQRDAWLAKLLPPVEQVRPGLWSVPVPIPNNPLRYVLSYWFEHARGVVVVDPGWPTEEAWQALLGGLSTAGVSVSDVTGVLVTHAHHDHHGLAGRIRAESGAWVAMHPLDAAIMRDAEDDLEAVLRIRQDWMRSCGAPEAEVALVRSSAHSLPPVRVSSRPDRLIEDGDELDVPGWALHARWTPGHSPGHLCFYEAREKLLLSGDHVLPRISPNISVFAGSPPDALADYLGSLDGISSLDVSEVLPGHEYRFSGLGGRVAQLLAHHRERLAAVARAVNRHPGCTTWELSARLTWARPWSAITGFQRRAALGETLAHLNVLTRRGHVRSVSPDGIQRWWPLSGRRAAS